MTSLESALAKPVVPGINGLRAFAVLMLVTGHYAGRFTEPSAWVPALANYSIVLWFVLTGFIVTHVLVREFDAEREIDLRAWFIRKGLRVYPTLLAALLVATAIQQRNGVPVPFERYVAYLAGYGNYYYALAATDEFRHALGPLWSIYVGAHFLAVWAVLLRAALRSGWADRLILPLACLVLSSAVLREAFSLIGVAPAYVYLSTESRVGEIAIGALGALLLRRDVNARRCASWLEHPLAGLAAVIGVGLLLTTASPVGPMVRLLATTLLVGHAIAANGGGIGSILDSRPFVLISRVSYSVFAWHLYALELDALFEAAPSLIRVPLGVGVVLTVGGIAFLILELPVRRLGERFRTAGGT